LIAIVVVAIVGPLVHQASPFELAGQPFLPPSDQYLLGTDMLGRNELIGVIDEILMRLTEIFQTIPTFLFAILVVAILSPSIGSVILAIAIVSWPPMARLVRGEFQALRNREFVQACISMGMSDLRVITLHILPNCLSSIIVTGSLLVATAILTESALSFLGLSDPNVMSWGFMVGAARDFLQRAWWLCAIPGVAILVTVLAINLVGDGLNDALNPRLRHL